MLITNDRSSPADAGAGEVAALHDDRGVELTLHRRRNLDVRHAGKLHQRRRRGVGVDDGDASCPSARSA